MPEQQILAGATHVFPAGAIQDHMQLDDRHNVQGNVRYQIGVRPAVNVPMVPNEDPVRVGSIGGLQVTVTNQLPNSLYVVY